MRKHLIVIAFLGLSIAGMICASPAQSASTDSLIITTLEQPPTAFTRDGTVVGISTEMLQKALGANKISATITSYPWVRAYDMALKDPMTCAYPTTRTEDREKLFKWVGPLARKTWLLVGRSDGPKVASLDEVRKKGYTIGGIVGFAETNYLISQGLKVDAVPNDVLNPDKLAAGRIDFWAQQKVEGKLSPEVPTQFPVILEFKNVYQYLACNRSVPDEMVDNLNAQIKTQTDDGVLAGLIKKYFP